MPVPQNFTGSSALVAGDTWRTFTAKFKPGTDLTATGTIVYVELKRDKDKAASYALIRNSPDSYVTVVDATTITFYFPRAITKKIPKGRVWYQVKVINVLTGTMDTTHEGEIQVEPWDGRDLTIPLTARAGADAIVTYGSPFALAGSASGGTAPYSYAWTLRSRPNRTKVTLANSAIANATATVEGPNGAVVLRLTVTDADGNTAYDEKTLTLNATLAEILSGNILLNYDARDIPNGAVASWPSSGSDTTAMAQASAPAQPVRSGTAFNTIYPGVVFDGVDDELLVTLSTPIPAGSRPYAFVVAALNSTVGSGTIFHANTAVTGASQLTMDYSGGLFRYNRINAAANDTNKTTGPADTSPHVFGLGCVVDTCAFAVDGCEYAGSVTGALDNLINRVRLGSNSTLHGNVTVAHAIVCGSMPDVSRIAAVNALLRSTWGLPDTILSSTEVFDFQQIDPANTFGNYGGAEAVDDSVYFIPWNGGGHIKLAKWNSQLPFQDPSAWSTKDLTSVGAQSLGFVSGCNDGRYVYLAPIQKMFIRYDTHRDFAIDTSYSAFDLTTVPGSVGGTTGGCVFDGRYVYVIPLFADDLRGHIVKRYDTLASAGFTSVASWDSFDIATINDGCRGYLGAGFDGRYVYFSPYANNSTTHGHFIRYDTTKPFGALGSWEHIDLVADVNPALKGINGIVCVGQYVYLVPGEVTYNLGDASVGARYDRTLGFADPSAYTTFDFHNVDALAQGFMFAQTDGRYIYYPQEHTSKVAVLRYDTEGAYASASSYRYIDNRFMNSGNKVGGAVLGQHRVFPSVGAPYMIKTYGSAAA
jgi:hypothetical protein